MPLDAALRLVVIARIAARRNPTGALAQALTCSASAVEQALPALVPQVSLARALGISPRALRRWARRGAFPQQAPGPGRTPGIPLADALALVEALHRPRLNVIVHRSTRPMARALRIAAGPAAYRP